MSHRLALVVVLLAALLIRVLFLAMLDEPVFDPWRHLALIDNVREGRGFTLYGGQPYLWYSPLWYLVAGVATRWVHLKAVVLVVSLAPVPLFQDALHRRTGDVKCAAIGGLLFALFGPAVAFTCHWGADGFLLLLGVASVWLASLRHGPLGSLAGGVLLGAAVAGKPHFALLGALVIPFLDRRSFPWFVAGALSSLCLHGARNYVILQQHAWAFTWDGLAIRSDRFGLLSTLFIPLQTDVARLNAILCQGSIPFHLHEFNARDFHAEFALVMGGAAVASMATRRAELMLAALLWFVFYFGVLGTPPLNLFRHHLPFFPIAFTVWVECLRKYATSSRWLTGLAILLFLLGGLRCLAPQKIPAGDDIAPPEHLLVSGPMFVSSALYMPDLLAYRHPERNYMGLPAYADELEAYFASFPSVRHVLLHGPYVQAEVTAKLNAWIEGGKLRVVDQAYNRLGFPFVLLERVTQQ